jgi:hypothetical protein
MTTALFNTEFIFSSSNSTFGRNQMFEWRDIENELTHYLIFGTMTATEFGHLVKPWAEF